MRLLHAEAGIRALARLAAGHEGEDAREIGLIRHGEQVEHQADVLLERFGNADRRRERGQFRGAARFGALDAALDLAHVLEVVVEPVAVRRPDRALQSARFLRYGVEDAAVLLHTPAAILRRAARPNSRSNATRGLISIGSGAVSDAHEIVFMYVQL